MKLEEKNKQICRSLKKARLSGNFRRIHKWEAKRERIQHKLCPWNPRYTSESLHKLKARVDAIRFRSDFRFEDYKWEWCGTCKGPFVRCPHCGNNCCNAVIGRFRKDGTKPTRDDKWEDLVDCTVCASAYDIQHFAYRTGTEPKRSEFPDADELERKADEWLPSSFDWLDELEKQKKAEEAVTALFNATPEELGQAAVDAVKKSQ